MKFKPWVKEPSEIDSKKDKAHNRNYSTGSIFHLKEVDCNQIINHKVSDAILMKYNENNLTNKNKQSVELRNNYFIDEDMHGKNDQHYEVPNKLRVKGRINLITFRW